MDWYLYRSMRLLLAVFLVLFAGAAHAARILLVPLDSRPAAGQFAQMIGQLAGAEVQMPPYELLGRFTIPGDPEGILAWINAQDLSDVTAIVVSADMLAYGGLIQSRVNNVSKETALRRIRALEQIKQKSPETKIYVFSALMRLAPTATKSTAHWRLFLAEYVAVRERLERTRKSSLASRMKSLAPKIPSGELKRYEAARARNHAVQRELIRMSSKLFDYLVVGQDDAQPFGPHIPETKSLRKLVDQLSIQGKVYFCEGIDQNSNVLVSRALLKAADWTPRVRVVYSDEAGKRKIAAFESKTIEESLRDQILASGARPALAGGPHDYTVFVNTPGRWDGPFSEFVDNLTLALDSDEPACLADINLNRNGISDPELFASLVPKRRMMKLLSFAGWNTAGNTMGTAIPAANMTLLARRSNVDRVAAEVAHKSFLLHRVVDDVMFHRYTRPKVYELIKAIPGANRDETYGNAFTQANNFVRKDLLQRLEATFNEQLHGLQFETPAGMYEFYGLNDPRIFLPWPRAYEMRLEFGLAVRPSATSSSTATAVTDKGR